MKQAVMRKTLFSAILLVVALVVLAITTGTNAANADTNLLKNSGFEGDYSSWLPEYSTAQVANNWTPWWVEDEDHDPIWAQPEWKAAHKRDYANRVFEGETAQQWFTFYKSHHAGMYQQVHDVTPGATYRFTVHVQAWTENENTGKSDTGSDPRFEIGIDPTGDARPGRSSVPSTVVWGGHVGSGAYLDQWHQTSVEVVAKNSTITVYMKSAPQWAVHHNDIYVDAASLVKVADAAPSTAKPAAPAPAKTGSGDCVIPATGPWPACAKAQTNTWSQPAQTNTWTDGNGCVIPATGPWPACAKTQTNTWTQPATKPAPNGADGCVIPATGAWPACARTQPAKPAQQTNTWTDGNGCVIPATGPWPACANQKTPAAPAKTWTQPAQTWTPPAETAPAQPAQQPAQTTPKPVAGGFAAGAQSHHLSDPGRMKDAGLGWIKFQHKWSKGDNADAVKARIDDAHAAGLKVLLAIPGSDHTNIDYAAYTAFLGGVAAYGPDAIEVWNEMNIDREWPSGQISGATYTNQMLKPAYQAIKAANPNVMVISGAPAPTGYFGGCSPAGCDDKYYMRDMYNAGAASYLDCVGVHYNEGIVSPKQTSGDPRGNSSYFTRYYQGMVNEYRAAFNNSKPLCFTELGFLSGQDFGGLPGGFAWADNTTVAQHAQWLGEAMELGKADPIVNMIIIFNWDIDHYGDDPQAGFAMIRPGNGCPACDTVRAALR